MTEEKRKRIAPDKAHMRYRIIDYEIKDSRIIIINMGVLANITTLLIKNKIKNYVQVTRKKSSSPPTVVRSSAQDAI